MMPALLLLKRMKLEFYLVSLRGGRTKGGRGSAMKEKSKGGDLVRKGF